MILENHLHLIVSSDDLSKTMRNFKSFTSKEILKYLKKENARTILEQLALPNISLIMFNNTHFQAC